MCKGVKEETGGNTYTHHIKILLEESMVDCFITNFVFVIAGIDIVSMSYL